MESVLVFLGGAGLGFLLGSGAGRLSIRKLVFKVASNTVERKSVASKQFDDMKGEWKLVIAVRQDLKMGKGKIAAQCAHGSMKAYMMASQKARESWSFYGQPTIITQVDTEEEMGSLFRKAKEIALPACVIRDAGRTQIARGTQTVLAVGPAPCSAVDKVTGALTLMH